MEVKNERNRMRVLGEFLSFKSKIQKINGKLIHSFHQEAIK